VKAEAEAGPLVDMPRLAFPAILGALRMEDVPSLRRPVWLGGGRGAVGGERLFACRCKRRDRIALNYALISHTHTHTHTHVCVCVCVCVHVYTYMHVHTHVFVCVYVCVCVYVRVCTYICI
jgi:hypothetical protein